MGGWGVGVGWVGVGVTLLSQPPTPKFDHFSQYATYDFAHYIANIWDIPAIFVFCKVNGVIYNMQMLFDVNTVLSHFPLDQTLKIYVKEMWQKMHQSCLIW